MERLTINAVMPSPVSGELTGSEELLGAVLLVNVLLVESFLSDDRSEDPGAGDELDFGETRVEDEALRLRQELPDQSRVQA